MSVILNALRKKKQEKASTDEGIVWSKSINIKSSSNSAKIVFRAFFVLAIFGLIGTIWLGYKKFNNFFGGHENHPVVSMLNSAKKNKKLNNLAVSLEDLLKQADKQFEAQVWDKSYELYSQALELNPNSAKIYNALGMIKLRQKMFKQAEGLFLQSLKIEPNCASCQNNLGYIKTILGDAKGAEAHLLRAATLNNNYSDPYFNLGVLYEKFGDVGNARSSYMEFLSRHGKGDSPLAIQVKSHLAALGEEEL